MNSIALHSVECGECPIRHRAVCAKCDDNELAQLEKIKFYKEYKAGETIVWFQEEMNFVGSVVSGVARLSQLMDDGRMQTVGLLLPSDFAGRPGRKNAGYEVVALEDTVMCCFQKGPFEELILRTPHIAQRLLDMTLDELDAAREWMLVLGRKTALEKIASLMVVLSRRSAALRLSSLEDSIQFTLPLTREGMADYLGLTIETVSRQMTKLRTEGTVKFEGARGIVIPDIQALLEASGDDDGGFLV